MATPTKETWKRRDLRDAKKLKKRNRTARRAARKRGTALSKLLAN